VCSFHHKLLHEFSWDMRVLGDEAAWFRPDGSRYYPGPDPPAREHRCNPIGTAPLLSR
jgi:hypothetical protein